MEITSGCCDRDQADAGQADARPQDRGHGAVDVEAPGGVRPEATPTDARGEVAPEIEAEEVGGASDAAARDRFEGEHPLVSWRPASDGNVRVEGYAPSECRTKQWPSKALSGAWHSRTAGGVPQLLFAQRRVRPENSPHDPRTEVALTDSFARSGARVQRRSRSTTIRPLQELARVLGRTILLTTHFSGADKA